LQQLPGGAVLEVAARIAQSGPHSRPGIPVPGELSRENRSLAVKTIHPTDVFPSYTIKLVFFCENHSLYTKACAFMHRQLFGRIV
jgi:hypothetical protein